VYFYVNRVPGKPVDPKVKEFLSYVLSREGQDAVQRDAKYLPLTSEVVRRQRKKLE
jgi:phosphate transport system substrate-binding protein